MGRHLSYHGPAPHPFFFHPSSLGSPRSLPKLGCDPSKLSSNGNLWAVKGLLSCLCSQDPCSGGCEAQTERPRQESEETGLLTGGCVKTPEAMHAMG